MQDKYLIPKHVRGLLERAILMPLPPGWHQVIADILVTGKLPGASDLLPSPYKGPSLHPAHEISLLIHCVRRCRRPWVTQSAKHILEILATNLETMEGNYERFGRY